MNTKDFEWMLLPLLTSLKQGNELELQTIMDKLVQHDSWSDENLKKIIPGGDSVKLIENVKKAIAQLQQVDLIESTGDDRFRITSFGLNILGRRPNTITVEFLSKLPGYSE
jgi:restriction system protein